MNRDNIKFWDKIAYVEGLSFCRRPWPFRDPWSCGPSTSATLELRHFLLSNPLVCQNLGVRRGGQANLARPRFWRCLFLKPFPLGFSLPSCHYETYPFLGTRNRMYRIWQKVFWSDIFSQWTPMSKQTRLGNIVHVKRNDNVKRISKYSEKL